MQPGRGRRSAIDSTDRQQVIGINSVCVCLSKMRVSNAPPLTHYMHHIFCPSLQLPPNVPSLLDTSRIGTIRHIFLAASSLLRRSGPLHQIIHYTQVLCCLKLPPPPRLHSTKCTLCPTQTLKTVSALFYYFARISVAVSCSIVLPAATAAAAVAATLRTIFLFLPLKQIPCCRLLDAFFFAIPFLLVARRCFLLKFCECTMCLCVYVCVNGGPFLDCTRQRHRLATQQVRR